MKPLRERLNDRLEQRDTHYGQHGQQPSGFIPPEASFMPDPEVDTLVALAQRLQAAQQPQVDPDFARQLKQRMLRRHITLQMQQTSKRPRFVLLRAHPAWSTVLGLCLLFFVLSTGVLALAAQVSNPNNPLYQLGAWEISLKNSVSGNPGDQAAFDLKLAQDQLTALPEQVNGEYSKALANLDQQINTAETAINQLPAGSQRTQLAGQLAALKLDAIRVLRSLLSSLSFPERLTTTDELTRLGDTVPHLTSATLTLPTHTYESATIRLSGTDILPGAQLLVNNRLIDHTTWTLQNGQVVFVVAWHGDQHPQSLGILNPDGTIAQITNVSINNLDPNHKGDDPNNNGDKNGKPEVTPTPGKPVTTPTPHH